MDKTAAQERFESEASSSAKLDQDAGIESVRSRMFPTYRHAYTHRDCILYALSIGCTAAQHMRLLYEGAPAFCPFPTFALIAAHPAMWTIPLDRYIPNYDKAGALHGEQYLELLAPIPTSGTLITKAKLVDIQDKGLRKGAVAVARTITQDDTTGKEVAINEFTVFALRAGDGRANSPTPPRPSAATAANQPPNRPADITASYTTGRDLAALYRLNGDYNPLHIDPLFSAAVGYPTPILHGLCSMGISARLLTEQLAGGDPTALRSIKVRFAKHVLPGETLRVDAWVTGPDTAVFRTSVVERGAVALTGGGISFWPGKMLTATAAKL